MTQWYSNKQIIQPNEGVHTPRSQSDISYKQRQRKNKPTLRIRNQPLLRPPWTILFQSGKRRWKITLSGKTKDKHNLNIKTRLIKISLPLSYQLCFMSQKNGHIPHNKLQNCIEKNWEGSLKVALFYYQELQNHALSLLAHIYKLLSKY